MRGRSLTLILGAENFLLYCFLRGRRLFFFFWLKNGKESEETKPTDRVIISRHFTSCHFSFSLAHTVERTG